MNNTVLYEPIQTHLYFKEYLDKIKYYDNIDRKSIFIRYLNINRSASIYNDDTKGTFDHFNSGVAYDIYDYTPAYSFGSISNTSTDKTDMAGLIYDGLGDLVIYTIKNPALGDLITFGYGPSESVEVFRVIQIDVSVYGKAYDVNYHRLTLEYAPIKDLSKLSIINNYVYLMTQEKNIFQSDYITLLKLVEKNKQFLELIQINFNERYELYYYIIDDLQIAPLKINNDIYNYLCYESKLDRYFDKYKKPFGVKDYSQIDDIGIDILSNLPIILQLNYLPIGINNMDNVLNYNFDILSYIINRP